MGSYYAKYSVFKDTSRKFQLLEGRNASNLRRAENILTFSILPDFRLKQSSRRPTQFFVRNSIYLKPYLRDKYSFEYAKHVLVDSMQGSVLKIISLALQHTQTILCNTNQI